MAAMQLACTSLWAGDFDTAVVGGLSCMTNSDIFAGLSKGQFLSKKSPYATFDNEADGDYRADGCATVIVKRLEDAEADKDNVLAVILGTATNHSADAISITHPHGETQELLYNAIFDSAGVDPLDIDYVEMHGTGTQAVDRTEMRSVTNVFAPVKNKRSRSEPLYIGSVKANNGHDEPASGVTAIIKSTVACLLSDVLPFQLSTLLPAREFLTGRVCPFVCVVYSRLIQFQQGIRLAELLDWLIPETSSLGLLLPPRSV